MGETNKAERPVSLNFIRDTAAEQDAFGSHDPVATAIANVIRSNDDIRVIGLLGPWGSGKSTVVRKIEAELKSGSAGKKTHSFCYDAWLYQSDPQRRSFLETYLRSLIEEGLTTEEEWKDQLNQLSRLVEETEISTTPSLTIAGKVALLLAFAVAFAMQFVGWDLVDAAFGKEASQAVVITFYAGLAGVFVLPVLSFIGLWVFLRPKRNPFSRKFWAKENRSKNHNDFEGVSVLGLLVNKAIETERHRLTRDPEPTAIEFQKIFKDIMDKVAAKDLRFLITIDNLDRLHEAEAMAMWATIRSFFLGSNQHGDTLAKLPTVILPIDEQAVEQMYRAEHGERAPTAAKAFMDKTFDLTFYVAPPVMTGWHAYLGKQMRVVFGSHLEERWVYEAGRLMERYWITNGPVTPRKINIAVNAIATLWLQRGGKDIGFASLALYAVFRDVIGRDVMKVIHTPILDISDLDPDWQRNLAALHFGVPTSDAIQVLIENDIRNAIQQGNREELSRLSKINGFPQIFRIVLETSQPAPAMSFVNSAAQLLHSLDVENAPWVDAAWQTIRKLMLATPFWEDLDEETSEVISLLLENGGKNGKLSLIQGVASKLSNVYLGGAEIIYLPQVAAVAVSLADAAENDGFSAPVIMIGGGAPAYLQALGGLENSQLAQRALRTAATNQEIADQIAKAFSTGVEAKGIEGQIKALIVLGRDVPWVDVIKAARSTIESHGASHEGMAPALYCVNHFARQGLDEAKQAVHDLAAGNILTSRLQEALDSNLVTVAARLTTLVLKSDASLNMGQDWASYVGRMPALPESVEREMIDPAELTDCHRYVAATLRTPSFMVVAKPVITKRVRDDDIGSLYVDQVVNQLDRYLACIEPEEHGRFLWALSQYESLWEEVDKAPFDANTILLLLHLARDQGEGADKDTRREARDRLVARLAFVDEATWENAVRSGSEPLNVALAVTGLSGKATPIGKPLTDVLERIMPELVTSFDRQLAVQWFRAASLIGTNARKTMFKNLRDRINGGAEISAVPELLDVGGQIFLKEGEFGKHADSSVRHIVLPLASQANRLDWLLKRQKEHSGWVKASSAETKGFLSEKLQDHWGDSDETGRDKLEQLASCYGLSVEGRDSDNQPETKPA